MAIDFAAEGLLDGLNGEQRRARLELLEKLAADGVPIEEIKAAVAEDRLALLPLERVLGGRYTAREVAEEAEVALEVWIRFQRALGLPQPGDADRVYGEEDVAAAKSIMLWLAAGLPIEALLDIARVMGEGMSRLAATITAAFAGAFLQPGDTERDVALRFAALAEQMLPALAPALGAAMNAHIRESVRRGMLGRAELETGRVPDALEMVVCFVDIVGFTRLGGQVDVEELGTVAGRLAEIAAEVTKRPVRLVKTIGDAAMFVCPEPAPILDVALSLVEAFEDAELPALRAGVASGPAVIRAGDYYGNSVNLASRVTGVARPGSVLATEEVREAASEGFSWSFAGRHRLKGIGEPVALYRARRPGDDGDGDGDSDGESPPHGDADQNAAEARRRRAARASRSKADRRRRRGSR
jgi:adenylate cyclase